MKTSKRVISLVLTAIMVMTSFAVGFPSLKIDTEAGTVQYDANGNIIIDGVSQARVVQKDNDAYKTTYDNYAAQYLNGASVPTNIVIPGLNAKYTDKTTNQDDPGDYVVQGMTYYPGRDWMLVTAYHSDGNASSKVFALDAKTGDFVAMFSFINTDGSDNMDHGGGIAVSENNIYYSCGDKDRKIAYAPLSALENAPLYEHTKIQLVDSIDFVEVGSIEYDGKTAYTAYVCYDQGVLWMGNFYDMGAKLAGITIAAADYNAPSNDQYNSMVFGYKLAGNSSAEEWDHLKGKFRNLFNVATDSGTASSNGANMTWNAYQNIGGVGVAGTITAPTAYVGELIGNDFGSFNLTEGVNYTIEFTSTNRSTDMYMWSPVGTHCNVKQSTQSKITQLDDGRYHYKMNFTAGLKPAGADSGWPTTQSTDGSYTGTYTVRFDQDAIQAGETREFAITDIKVSQANTYANAESVHDEGYAGAPSYALALDNTLKDVQYATVDNGKLYLSRSYGSGAGNSINFGFGDTSKLTVADIDLSQPGTVPVTISTTSTGSKDKTVMAHNIADYTDYNMMPMSEGLCVIEGNIFITFEGASNKYKNESTGLTSIGNCEKPVDVIWQLDPYELMETTVVEPEASIYYEKVNSLSEIKDGEEYIIVHESDRKDPVTQKNYLYALNADGNFKDYKLSKSTADAIKGYNGMIGHPISYYSFDKIGDKEILYLEEPEKDDVEAVRWELTKTANQRYRFKNAETYFANCNYLYFDESKISMAPGNTGVLNNMSIQESGDGKGGFWISNAETYFLWCNDGTTELYNTRINSHYIKSSGSIPICSGLSETPGTFHCDALNLTQNNIIGIPVLTGADTFYEDGLFNIYRRVVDSVASTYESRVYTDLDAELQEDGTYKVTLETYAISPNHYQYVGERPTDYIIVADTSSSMASTGSTGIAEFNGSLSVSSLSVDANTSDDNGKGVNGYGFSNPDEDIYLKHTDGKYYKVYMAVNTTELDKFIGMITNIRQKYYAYYIADDGLYYCIQDHAVNPEGRTYSEWKAWVDSGENESDYSTKKNNSDRKKEDVYQGLHYRFDEAGDKYNYEHVRLDTLKTTVNDLIGDIAAQNGDNRIALVQYGADTSSGYYNTSGNLVNTGFTDAFWSAGDASGLQAKVSALGTSAQTNNNGIELQYANSIINNSGVNYKAGGDRNVAIIFVTDGIPGQDDGGSAKAAADAVIGQALTAKNNGAFVYTALLGNNEVSGFNKKNYIDGVSSKYAAAESLDKLGGMSVDGVNYSISLASTTINNFLDFGAITTEEVKTNSAVGLDNLDDRSYLLQQLNDAFKFPADFNKDRDVAVELITGEYDEIGRFSFNEANKSANEIDANAIKSATDVNTQTKTLTVTGYDYAKEYIAKNRQEEGRKLRVTISGLLADETADIRNTSINKLDTTGIYKEDGKLFRNLPTAYFNIPEYTYVLDYGISMYDSDVNGILKSVESDLSAIPRNADGTLQYRSESENGLVEITEDKLDLIYKSTPTNFADSGYCLIQREDGTYDWFEIKVVPASNVLFEENYIENKSGSTGAAWSKDGETKSDYQTPTNNNTDVYGYDDVYATGVNAHSYGSADKVTVSTNTKRSATKTFDFVGKGIDLISACGENTGIMIVKISGGNLTSPKVYIVDTYYGGDYAVGEFVYQTPIVSFRGDYGTYTVEATAAYLSSAGAVTKSITNSSLANGKLSGTTGVPVNDADVAELLAQVGMEDIASADVELVWFDDNSILNGGTGAKGNVRTARDGSTTTSLDCYLDGFRVYNPLNDDSSLYKSSEKGAVYYNVIEHLQNSGVTDADLKLGDIAYVINDFTAGEDGSIPALSFGNYQNIGPQNEFYLKNGATDGLAFKVSLNTPDSRVQLGLRAVTGTAKVKIGFDDPNTDVIEPSTEFEINTATEMYYDITQYLTKVGGGTATVTIQNTGDTVLAVNNIKVTGEAAIATIEESELEYAAMMMASSPVRANVVNGVVTPVTDDATEPDDGNTSIPGGDVIGNAPSFVQELLAKLFEILSQVFTFLPVGEVM
ncbi:MAG: VWA domain-containing protein [Clostridia bacterium]|nr:VWA domain-containing protein [Clostridia bacterium]